MSAADVSYRVEIPPSWEEQIAHVGQLRQWIGYWANASASEKGTVTIVENDTPDAKAQRWAPTALARSSYVAGCRRWGEGWYTDGRTDAIRYGVAIQLAVLGEVRYG